MDESFQTNSILEIYSVDFAERGDEMRPLGNIQVRDYFHKIAWGTSCPLMHRSELYELRISFQAVMSYEVLHPVVIPLADVSSHTRLQRHG